jgi:hypothetical protein
MGTGKAVKARKKTKAKKRATAVPANNGAKDGACWQFLKRPEVLEYGHGRGRAPFEYILYNFKRLLPAEQDALRDQVSRYAERPENEDWKEFLEKDIAACEKDGCDGSFACLKIGGQEIPLGIANQLDKFIWDTHVRSKVQRFQTLSMFTKDVQANYVLMLRPEDGTTSPKPEFLCTFFEAQAEEIPEKDLHFAKTVGLDGLLKLKGQKLNELVWWNQYIVERPEPAKIVFKRQFRIVRHECRKRFQNIPLLTEPLNSDRVSSLVRYMKGSQCTEKPALDFYSALQKLKGWVPGVGSPMLQNLDQLGSAMSNKGANVTLVSGMPGTGKENYMRALHFAGTPCDEVTEKHFVLTTALTMEADKEGVVRHFTKDCESIFAKCKANWRNTDGDIPVTYVIDELNKAGERTRSELLRVLENTATVLGDTFGEFSKRVKMRFILAASDHLDELGRHPPQDFWTRITNQMRVSHPLSRVSESDAMRFIEAFFWFAWYKNTVEWIDETQGGSRPAKPAKSKAQSEAAEAKEELAKEILGSQLDGGSTTEDGLAGKAQEEFVSTLTPIAMRDEISLRGLRSMMQQIFYNVIWSTRYGLVPKEYREKTGEIVLRRSVNHAVQDVIAILNASRSTPRTSAVQPDSTQPSRTRAA